MAESRASIYGAIAANVAIAATKFIVAAVSGSSAMLSEGIHSTVDTGNGLLLIGTSARHLFTLTHHPVPPANEAERGMTPNVRAAQAREMRPRARR